MVATRRSTRLRAVAETPSPASAQPTPAASTGPTSRGQTVSSSASTPEVPLPHKPPISIASISSGLSSASDSGSAPSGSESESDTPSSRRRVPPRPPTRPIRATRSSARLSTGGPLPSSQDVNIVPPSDGVDTSPVRPAVVRRAGHVSAARSTRLSAPKTKTSVRTKKEEEEEEWNQSGLADKTFNGEATEDEEDVTAVPPSRSAPRHKAPSRRKKASKSESPDVSASHARGALFSSGAAGKKSAKPHRAAKRKLKSESESENDAAPLASRKPRANATHVKLKADVEEDESDPNDSDFKEATVSESLDEGSDNSDLPMALGADNGVGGARGSNAEDLRWETKKQREKRLRSRKRKDTRSRYDIVREKMLPNHPELSDIWSELAETPVRKVEQATQPPGMTINLLPFQLEGINWLTKQEKSEWGGGILADEMGMGKTIQMIGLFMSDYHEAKGPALVVAPTVAIMQWRNEINKYTPGMNVLMWHGLKRERDANELKNYDVVLTSYQTMERSFSKQEKGWRRQGELIFEPSPLHSTHWHRIVLDEAHNIKERSTNMAKAAFELDGDYRWCLSGTPLQNRVGELYSMIRFLGADPYAYYFCLRCDCKALHWMFSDRRHCDQCGHTPMSHTCFWNNEILKPIQRGGVDAGEGRDAFGRLHSLLGHLMLRRTKLERADDMGLPPRTVLVRRDMFNEEEEDLYESLYKDTTRKFSTYLSQGTVLNNYSNIFTLLTRMRQMANHPDLVLRSQTGMAQHLLADDAAQNNRVCRICMDVAEDPILSKCRHVFCRLCIREYLETEPGSHAHAHDCPYCHATIVIDLEQEALSPPIGHDMARQGILARLDMDQWRSSTKIEALVEELVSLRREDATIKSLVFSQFTNFLDLIAFRLQRAGFAICRLEGSMTPEARDKTIKHFQRNTHTTVLLLSLKAGGVALNLVEASRVYLMDVRHPSLRCACIHRCTDP